MYLWLAMLDGTRLGFVGLVSALGVVMALGTGACAEGSTEFGESSNSGGAAGSSSDGGNGGGGGLGTSSSSTTASSTSASSTTASSTAATTNSVTQASASSGGGATCTTTADCAVGECCYAGLNFCGPDIGLPEFCL